MKNKTEIIIETDDDNYPYKNFFNDNIALGYTKEKTQLRKFIHRLIITYREELQMLRQKINLITMVSV